MLDFNISALSARVINLFNKLYAYVIVNDWLLSLILGLVVIFSGVAMGFENNQIVIPNPLKLSHYTLEPSNALSFLAGWDGVRYISIAVHGYNNAFVTGFFPLYPLVASIIHVVISSPLDSALIISWASFIGAIYFYLKIIKRFFNIKDNAAALKAVLLFVLFPSAMYMIAAYSESLFALFALGGIYYALERKYLKAGLMTMFATAARINGVFIVLFVALILFEEKEKIINIFKASVIGSLGAIFYMIYLYVTRKNPLLFLKAQETHHWLQSSLITKLGSFGWVDYVFALAILWTAVYWWNKRRSFSVFTSLFLLIPIIGGQFGGYPRYVLMAFPLQFMLFDFFKDRKIGYTVILIIFSMAWTYTLLQFAAGYIIS